MSLLARKPLELDGILAPIEQQEQDHLWAAGKHGMEMCVCINVRVVVKRHNS
jgi:hypothetical protein